MNGVMRLKRLRRRIDPVWQCSKCNNYRVHESHSRSTHQTCANCQSMTIIKLKCILSCGEILPFDTKVCPKCDNKLQHRHTIDALMNDEEEICKNKFLRVWNNFNTNKQNCILLFYGYIYISTNDSILHTNFPLDIAEFCMNLAIYLKRDSKIQWIGDFWNKAPELSANKSIILNDNKTELMYTFILFSTSAYLKDSSMYLDVKTVRKLWKIKVNKHYNKPLTFDIGIEIRDIYAKFGLIIKNGLVSFEPNQYKIDVNDKSDIYVNDNDIISILLLNNSCGKSWSIKEDGNEIKFAINNTICSTQYKNIFASMYNWNSHRVAVNMLDCIKLTVIKAD